MKLTPIAMEPHNRFWSTRHERAVKELNREIARERSGRIKRIVIIAVFVVILYSIIEWIKL